MAKIRDGTSNTVLGSEIINTNDRTDDRGAWGLATGPTFSGKYETKTTLNITLPPNSTNSPDCSPYSNNDTTNVNFNSPAMLLLAAAATGCGPGVKRLPCRPRRVSPCA